MDQFPGGQVGVADRPWASWPASSSARTRATSEIIQKGADALRRRCPVWNPNDGAIDMYYWYYGTLAMFQVGGDAVEDLERRV